MGCLLFDDAALCPTLHHMLQDCIGSSIKYLGGLDLSQTF
jgi:hypothetical protein